MYPLLFSFIFLLKLWQSFIVTSIWTFAISYCLLYSSLVKESSAPYPALFTKNSMLSFFSNLFIKSSSLLSSVKSKISTCVLTLKLFSISSATALIFSTLLPTNIKSYPFLANWKAYSFPIPLVAPVITAILPNSFILLPLILHK